VSAGGTSEIIVSKLLCLGLGYTAAVFASRMSARGWSVTATARTPERVSALRDAGIPAIAFDGTGRSDDLRTTLNEATHLLVSAPPDADGDPLLRHHGQDLTTPGSPLSWIGYLSTIGVYGDQRGAWVDEDTPPAPTSERSRRRLEAELAWLDLGKRSRIAVHVFRLAGIYGPGRSAIDSVRDGTARRIIKPGQVFNRIHVDDIANTLEASIAQPRAGAIYNVTDLEPAPPQNVIAYAAQLVGAAVPPEIAFEDAGLSEMGRSFYAETKRVSNALIIAELGVTLSYPTYREGLAAIASRAV
jgi:hypothetical protein